MVRLLIFLMAWETIPIGGGKFSELQTVEVEATVTSVTQQLRFSPFWVSAANITGRMFQKFLV